MVRANIGRIRAGVSIFQVRIPRKNQTNRRFAVPSFLVVPVYMPAVAARFRKFVQTYTKTFRFVRPCPPIFFQDTSSRRLPRPSSLPRPSLRAPSVFPSPSVFARLCEAIQSPIPSLSPGLPRSQTPSQRRKRSGLLQSQTPSQRRKRSGLLQSQTPSQRRKEGAPHQKEWRGITGYPIKSSYKSFHSGFIDSISASFFFREPAFTCFSRMITDSIDGATS